MVLAAPDATAQQREQAGYYLVDAAVFIANSKHAEAPHSPTRGPSRAHRALTTHSNGDHT